MAFPGASYVTATEFADAALGVDLTGITDPQLLQLLADASRMAEQYAGHTWAMALYTDEQHVWRRGSSRRVYPRHWPIFALTGVTLQIGASTQATLNIADWYINNQQRYIELAQMALAYELTPALLDFGLAEPVFEVSYIAGNGSLEDTGETLAEAIAAQEVVWTVSDGTVFAVNDVLRVDTDIAAVLSIAVDDLTVTRTAPSVTHALGSAIYRYTSAAPDEVKLAIIIIAAALIAQRRLSEEGIAGVRSFAIGSYSVTVGRGEGEPSGFARIPLEAQNLLRGYRMTSLR